MKKYLLAIIICFILAILITGVLIKPITPILFSGKTFENRSSSMQSLMIITSILILSFILFLLYYLSKKTFLRNQSIEKLIIHFSSLSKKIGHYKYTNLLIIISLIIIACALFFVQIKLITFPYQLEYGEGSFLINTGLFINGINPYAIENNHINFNYYGFGYPSIVFPLALIFGNSLFIHRLVNLIFTLGSSILIFIVLKKQKVNLLSSIIAVMFFWLGMLFGVTPTARPDSFAVFLFLLTLFIPFINNFNSKALLISGFLGILALYTKIYFFIGSPILFSYLFLFVSKRKGILYGLIILIGLTFSAFVIRHTFYMYFANTFFQLIFGGYNYGFFHFVKQTTKFVRDYWGILLIGIFAIHLLIKANKKISLKYDLSYWDLPLIVYHENFFLPLYGLIICSLIIFLRMGWHTGTYQTYYYQLLTPFLVITIMSFVEKSGKPKPFFIILTLLTLSTQVYENLRPDFSDFNIANWKRLEEYMTNAETILNSPVEISILIEQNKQVNYSFFSFYYFLLPKYESYFWPDPDILQQQGEDYVKSIAEKIRSGKYDIVVRNANQKYGFFVGRLDPYVSNENFLEQYYRPIDNIMITMPHTMEEWDLQILAPNY